MLQAKLSHDASGAFKLATFVKVVALLVGTYFAGVSIFTTTENWVLIFGCLICVLLSELALDFD